MYWHINKVYDHDDDETSEQAKEEEKQEVHMPSNDNMIDRHHQVGMLPK